MKVRYDGLYKLLAENDMTKTSLIKNVGVSTSVISAMAHERPISMKAAISICAYFNCDFSDIMTLWRTPDDMIAFLLSVYEELFNTAKSPDSQFEIQVEFVNFCFEFSLIYPDGKKELLMTLPYYHYQTTMSRQEMKKEAEPMVQYIIEIANRQFEQQKVVDNAT